MSRSVLNLAALKTLGSVVMRLGRQQRLIVDAALLGVAGALASQLFTYLLRGATWLFQVQLAGYRPPGLPDEGGVLREVIGAHGLWVRQPRGPTWLCAGFLDRAEEPPRARSPRSPARPNLFRTHSTRSPDRARTN